MSRRGAFDAIVVGAGMLGAATALALAQRDWRVALVEERAPPPWRASDDVDLRVVALAPSSVDLLAELGVWSDIASSRASAYRHMHVWDAANGAALTFDAAEQAQPELGWIVENRLIQHALWQALERDGRVERRCPARVVATDVEGDIRQLTLADDTRLAARVVIAADGAMSPLRDMAGIATGGRDYAQRAVVAHVATERPHAATAWQRFTAQGPLAFLPLADGRSSIVWSVPEDEAARLLALDDATFRAELGCAFDFRLGPITATTTRASFPLRLQLAERYVAPRFALIGDAAHQVHPLAGQGVNLGFRDVATLVDAFADAHDRGAEFASESALRRYERQRRSDNAISAWSFDGIDTIFRADAELLVAARGIGIRTLNFFGPLKRLLAGHAGGR